MVGIERAAGWILQLSPGIMYSRISIVEMAIGLLGNSVPMTEYS